MVKREAKPKTKPNPTAKTKAKAKTKASTRTESGGVKDVIRRLFDRRDQVQSSDIAEATGLSRQALHRHLRRLVDAGEIIPEGSGRAARYRKAKPSTLRLPLTHLAEDRVWKELAGPALERLGPLSTDAGDAFHYAFTELLNNAIEHSSGRSVELRFERAGKRLAFEIIDDGVGVFHRVREGFSLLDDLTAVQELSKGKLTTMPERHTGEGIFFSSKVADVFELESGRLRWIVDNDIADTAVGGVALRKGTRARFELRPRSTRSLQSVFEEYTEDFEFSKTRTWVKLFAIGVRFVSRSEARRLLHGVERFREVVLDFSGVELVGQGFADEVFRVWAKAHPEVRLVPFAMAGPVAFMVARVRRETE